MTDMPDKAVDLCLTDPPYGMEYRSNHRKRTDKFDTIAGDSTLDWVEPFAKELYRVMKDNTHIYLFCNEYCMGVFRKVFTDAGFMPKRMLVWIKNNTSMGDLAGDYASKTEYILFFHKGRRHLSGRRDSNVLQFKRIWASLLLHPTQKPIEICEYLIKKSSDKGELVFDPFVGAGSTCIAADRLDRQWIGVELEPKYCEIARERVVHYQKRLF